MKMPNDSPEEKTGAPGTSAARPLLIGEILVQADIVNEHQLPRALQMAKDRSLRIGQVLVMMRYLSDDELEPILQIQKLINEGSIDSESAIEALRVMRRDGVPLVRAVEKVRLDQPGRQLKEAEVERISAELVQLEQHATGDARELAPLLLRLGDALLDLREGAQAEKHYKRALGILEHSHGSKNVKNIAALLKLIELYVLLQRYSDAEGLCWRCFEINQAAYGADHLETARSLQKLARVLDAESRYAESEKILLSAIRIMEKQLGIEHPELKAALRHYSSFWKHKSRQQEHKRIGELLVEAELVTADMLAVALKEANQSAVPLGQTLTKMGVITQSVLRAGLQAQLLVQDGVVPSAIATKALRFVSARDVTLENALEEIGWHPDPISTKDLQKLMETSDELMAAEKALGADHPGVSIIAMKLGDQYIYARKFAYAENAYKRALNILKKCWGQNSIELADCLFKLANLYYVQKRFPEAESLHWKVLEIRKNELGEDDPAVAQSLEHIAKLAESQGNTAQAEQMRQAAKSIRTKGSDERRQLTVFLRERTPFGLFDDVLLEKLSGIADCVEVAAGENVFLSAEMPDCLYVVRQGRIELLQDQKVVACVRPGELFGDFGGQTRSAVDSRAIEPAALLRFKTELVRDLRGKSQDFDQVLLAASEKLVFVKPSVAQPKPTAVLEGNFAFLDPSSVLQAICAGQIDGYLKLSDHQKKVVASLAIRNGKLVFASYRHLTGVAALNDLITRNDPHDFIFQDGEVTESEDVALSSRSLDELLSEASKRADELPSLLESLSWPRVSFQRAARVLDCSSFDAEIASVAADIWLLMEDGASNEAIIDGVYSDRYTFLLALRELLRIGAIRRDDGKTTGSFRRLTDLQQSAD